MYEFDSSKFHTLQQTRKWLQQGNLLAYPTESVWGIGCDAMNQQAVRQILAIKNRPIDKGMIVVTDSVEKVKPLLIGLTNEQRETIGDSWDMSNANNQKKVMTKQVMTKQAITWLLPIPKEIIIPHWITGKHNSVAVRVIAHPLIQQLCQSMVSEANPFGFIISTSCNPATFEPARTIQEAQSYFDKFENVGYLQGETLGYELPSKICDGVSGEVVR